MTPFPRALGTQISERKTGAAVQCQLPGKMYRAVVTIGTRVQTTPGTRKREAENGKLVTIITSVSEASSWESGWKKGDKL